MPLKRAISFFACVLSAQLGAEEIAPRLRSNFALPAPAKAIAAKGNQAFVAASDAGLLVIDYSNASSPATIGQLDTPGSANEIKISGNLAYIADGADGLQIIDISDPSAPRIINTYPTTQPATDIELANHALYLLSGSNIEVLDISNLTSPAYVRTLTRPFTKEIAINHRLLCSIPTGEGGLVIQLYDTANPLDPTPLATIERPQQVPGRDFYYGFALTEKYLLATAQAFTDINGQITYGASGGFLYDISNPAQPVFLEPFAINRRVWPAGPYLLSSVGGVGQLFEPAENGFFERGALPMLNATGGAALLRDLLITANEATLQAVQLLPATPRASSTVILRDSSNIAVRGNLAFVATPDGLKIFDTSNSTAPRYLAVSSPPSRAQSLVLGENHIYISTGDTFQTIDISDPSNPRTTSLFPSSTLLLGRVRNRLYALATAQAIPRISALDISDPVSPVDVPIPESIRRYSIRVWECSDELIFILKYLSPEIAVVRAADFTLAGSWTHPTEIIEMKVVGNRAYCLGPQKLGILDITKPIAPILLGDVTLPDLMSSQTGFTVLGSYAYLASGQSLTVCDLSNESAPRVVARNASLLPNRVVTDGQRLHVLSYRNGYSILEPHPQIWIQPTATTLRLDAPPDVSGYLQSSRDLQEWFNFQPLTFGEEPIDLRFDDFTPNRFFRFRSNPD